MNDVLGLVLGGGRGADLYPLTKHRSTPAVPIGGMYRLIDVPISNCINSEVRRVFVLTQFLAVSLHRHIANTYKFAPFRRGFVEVLAAQQTNEGSDWYRGTADAIRQNLRYLGEEAASDFLVLSADGLYRMDFRELAETHRRCQADVTLAVLPVARDQAMLGGVVQVDADGRLTALVEKPTAPEQLARLERPEASDRPFLASMGIYLCRRDWLLDRLAARPQAADLVTEVLAADLGRDRLFAHVFSGYWQDLGRIRSYYEANLALAGERPPFDFHVPRGVIYTHMRNLPASRVRGVELDRALIAEGCHIQHGAAIQRSVIGLRTQVGRDAQVRDTVVCGADRYEPDAERAANHSQGIPDLGIGDRSVIERAILDKDCRIGADVRIVNARGVRDVESTDYVIREGIVVVPKGAVIPDGTVI